jgi:hypothetical protein
MQLDEEKPHIRKHKRPELGGGQAYHGSSDFVFGVVKMLRHNLLQGPVLTDVLCIYCVSIIHCIKWQNVYGAHKLQVPLLGRSVSGRTLVRNNSARKWCLLGKANPFSR